MTAVRTMPVPLDAGRAVCSDPEWLPLVDAAAEKPGGPEAQEMKRKLCRHCPVSEACHAWAMTHAEVGIWGGVSPSVRSKRGAPKALPTVSRALHLGTPEGTPAQTWRRNRKREQEAHVRKTDVTVPRLAELGVTSGEVKRWAYEQGLVPSIMGRVSLATVEAWVAAHTHQA